MRIIVDGNLADAVAYYEMFPCEPTVNPDSLIRIDLPIPANDRLRPITLMSILDRMLTVQERQVLVFSHGNPDGLVVPLIAGSQFHVERANLQVLTQFGNARQRSREVAQMPANERSRAWVSLLGGLRGRDGQTLVQGPIAAGQQDAYYEQLCAQLMNGAAGSLGLNRAQLDQILDRRDRVRGKFDRIEFRGCNIGKSQATLTSFCNFFGVRQVVAPDAVLFNASFPVTIEARFENDFDQQVRTQTRRVLRHAPARPAPIYAGNRPEHLPQARSFDVSTTAGNEVSIRLWATSIHPHRFAGWMVSTDRPSVRTWIQLKIIFDTSRYTDGARVPVQGLWLRDDQDVPLAEQLVLDGDPLAAATPPLPFAFPLEPPYRRHLIMVATAGPP